jgi:host factor-I protein
MSNQTSVQDEFLQTLAKENTLASVYMVNGIRLTGRVESFDRFVIILASPAGRQILFKHAISTVMPGAPERTSRSSYAAGTREIAAGVQ